MSRAHRAAWRYRIPRNLVERELGGRELGGAAEATAVLRWRWPLAVGLAALAYAPLVWLVIQDAAPDIAKEVRRVTPAVSLIYPPPPPSQPPPKPPQLPPPRRAIAESPAPVQPKLARPAAAAAAAASVTAAPAAAPLDMTAFTIPAGTSSTYVGGKTAGSGRGAVEGQGALLDKGTAVLATQARLPRIARRNWTCAWPEGAGQAAIRDVRVRLVVEVSPEGTALDARVEGDVSEMFARAAQQCALRESYQVALDANGHRVSGVTAPFIVHFTR